MTATKGLKSHKIFIRGTDTLPGLSPHMLIVYQYMGGSYDHQTGRYLLCGSSPGCGSEQGGVRPVLIIQNDVGNRHSPTVICAAITSRMNKAKLPTHVELKARNRSLVRDSVILLEQVRTIDKQRLREKICHIDGEMMRRVDEAMRISLELGMRERSFEFTMEDGSWGLEKAFAALRRFGIKLHGYEDVTEEDIMTMVNEGHEQGCWKQMKQK